MNERRDDTTPAAPESRRAPGSYYYDDATGYEVFDPEACDEDEAEGERETGTRPASDGPAAPPRLSERACRP